MGDRHDRAQIDSVSDRPPRTGKICGHHRFAVTRTESVRRARQEGYAQSHHKEAHRGLVDGQKGFQPFTQSRLSCGSGGLLLRQQAGARQQQSRQQGDGEPGRQRPLMLAFTGFDCSGEKVEMHRETCVRLRTGATRSRAPWFRLSAFSPDLHFGINSSGAATLCFNEVGFWAA